jgi:hypothetical protein
VEGHSARGQTFKDVSYVDFGAACNTYVKFREIKVNELLQKLKNLVARRWNPKNVRTFIQGIDY